MSVDDLYELDFYEWSQQQAVALRARGRGAHALDYERLAEEVGDLGKSEFRAARSLTARILEHLFKLAWSQNEAPKNGWRAEVERFRRDLEAALTPTIQRMVEADLERLHVSAAKTVELQFRGVEPNDDRDHALRWTMRQVLGENSAEGA